VDVLFPFYLLGALAIAIPIALHLRRRPPKDRVEFSSLLFLDPQTPQRKRRSKLENLLLLILRCLAILLLALLFSRPFFRDPNALAQAGEGVCRIVLLDRSASMRRTGLWEDAVKKARAALEASKPEDRVAFLTFDSAVQTVTSFEQWKQQPSTERIRLASDALAVEKPGWEKTALDAALIEAVGMLEDETRGTPDAKQIVLISDLQEGADQGQLEHFAWPESIELRLEPVVIAKPGNAAAHLVAKAEEEDEDEETARRDHVLRVRVTNSQDAKAEKLKLAWENDAANALEVLLPPGATRVVTAPPRPEKAPAYLQLEGDAEDFDDRVYIAPPQARPVNLLYIGDQIDAASTESPLFYVERALSPTDTLVPKIAASKPAELTREKVLASDAIVSAAALSVEQGAWLHEFAESGGVILLALKRGETVPAFVATPPLEVKEAVVNDYAMLQGIDFDHPVLRPFAGPGLRDFTKIHFWRYRKLSLPKEAKDTTRVLASFDTGDPALVEFRLDRGRVFLFTSAWTPSESQLALSSKFVPLLYSMLGTAGFESQAKRQFYAGDVLPGPAPEAVMKTPDGKTLPAGQFRTDAPGIYAITQGTETFTYAVNVPVSESRLEPLKPEFFTAAGITLPRSQASTGAEPTPAEKMQMERVELEGRQKLWKWLLAAAVLILLAETFLANRPARASTANEEAAPAQA